MSRAAPRTNVRIWVTLRAAIVEEEKGHAPPALSRPLKSAYVVISSDRRAKLVEIMWFGEIILGPEFYPRPALFCRGGGRVKHDRRPAVESSHVPSEFRPASPGYVIT